MGVPAQVFDCTGAFWIVCAERPHVIPDWHVGESCGKDSLLVVFDFNGADGPDSVDDVGENAPPSAGEKMQRVFRLFHI
jgi:hypothetical protein